MPLHHLRKAYFSVQKMGCTTIVEHESMLAFEEAEKPSVDHIVITTNDGSQRYPDNRKADDENPAILVLRTDKRLLGPGESNFGRAEVFGFSAGQSFCALLLRHTHVSVDAPGFTVSSDFGKDQTGSWQTPRLFLIGDKITLRWKPASLLALNASGDSVVEPSSQ